MMYLCIINLISVVKFGLRGYFWGKWLGFCWEIEY